MSIPQKPFGRTGETLSAIGVGGHHLGYAPTYAAAERIVHEALDAGITFFDNAWEYNEHRSEEWLGRALHGRRERAFVMTKVCSHGRDKHTALAMLDESLARLQTDHLDLWQLHAISYENSPDLAYRSGGELEALAEAKAAGKVRFVGFTGHKHPRIHLNMLAGGFPFDAVQMPLNPFDAQFRSFERAVLPEVARRGMAAIGMKSMNGTGMPFHHGDVPLTPEEALRYAMSLPVATTVCGMESIDVLRQNVAVAQRFQPYAEDEMQAIRDRVAASAGDGRFEIYKTSLKYDNTVLREQHGFALAGAS